MMSQKDRSLCRAVVNAVFQCMGRSRPVGLNAPGFLQPPAVEQISADQSGYWKDQNENCIHFYYPPLKIRWKKFIKKSFQDLLIRFHHILRGTVADHLHPAEVEYHDSCLAVSPPSECVIPEELQPADRFFRFFGKRLLADEHRRNVAEHVVLRHRLISLAYKLRLNSLRHIPPETVHILFRNLVFCQKENMFLRILPPQLGALYQDIFHSCDIVERIGVIWAIPDRKRLFNGADPFMRPDEVFQ